MSVSFVHVEHATVLSLPPPQLAPSASPLCAYREAGGQKVLLFQRGDLPLVVRQFEYRRRKLWVSRKCRQHPPSTTGLHLHAENLQGSVCNHSVVLKIVSVRREKATGGERERGENSNLAGKNLGTLESGASTSSVVLMKRRSCSRKTRLSPYAALVR